MASLIVIVILGLGFAYFASQNTAPIIVNVLGNSFGLPIYLVVLGSLLLGLLVSGIINAFDSLSSMFEIHNRDTKIKQKEQTVEQLSRQVHDLEMENARLNGLTGRDHPEPHSKTNKARLFIQKLRGQIPA
jgi:uncharacterized integral membrane protein